MMYHGVGWIRPTRLAPEGSPFFSVPGGSLAGLSDLITEVPLNGRLEGLGCGCSRGALPGMGAMLDRNRREGFYGLRGDPTGRGWAGGGASFVGPAYMSGLGAGASWDVSDGETLGTDEAAEMREEDILFAADPAKRQAAVTFLQTMLSLLQEASTKAQGIGAPGWWPGESYWQQFVDIQQPILAQVEAGSAWKVRNWLTTEERDSYVAALNAFNSAVLRTQNAKNESSVDNFKATLMNLGLTISDVGQATKAVGKVVMDEAGDILNTAGEVIKKGVETATSVGKWVTIALVAAAALYGMSFLPRGRG